MDWMKFAKLAMERKVGFEIKNYTNYSRFQEYQAKEIIKELDRLNIKMNDLRVLELAAGVGGYSTELYRSCGYFVSSDIYKFPNYNHHPFIDYILFDASRQYPFKDDSFDFIFCSSLIEHINDPAEMLREVKRVLTGNGFLYLSFPPFFSPYGGHFFSPYHYLGEKNAVKITKKFNTNIGDNVTEYSNCWGEGRGLFKRTIRSVRTLLHEFTFDIEYVWPRFMMNFNFAKVPLLNEVLCWHVCFVCRNNK